MLSPHDSVEPVISEPAMQPQGWVLYDDSCGFCRRWIPFWEPTLHRRGLRIAALQDSWVQGKFNMSETELTEDLRLLFPNGRHIQGADVYRYVMARIWWSYPLYMLASAPGLRRIFDWCYRTFATNRYRFSRACGLSGHSTEHPE